ncbi:FtsK/SpoIIIE domain-containing protein [Isoptericola jiangsuensis]|uniref:FtsK/SpoIIIE domain-containing protein n=1 Tax=Isoptericola jiangsuensis TaxID=548579 RepID=UPI003AB08C8A
MPVRLTLHPGEDVDLPDGVRLGDVRAELARIVRRPELLRADLLADGTPVGDGSVVGRRPLLPGATLRAVPGPGPHQRSGTGSEGSGPVPADPDVEALRSPWVVRSTTGPATGDPRALAPGRPVSLDAHVTIDIDGRGRPRIRPDAPWRAAARAAGRAAGRATGQGAGRPRTGPSLHRPGRGRERRSRLLVPRRWHEGDVLEVAGGAYALERSGDAVTLLAPEPLPATAEPAVRGTMLLVGVVPVVGSIALAVALRQPLYALFSLVGIATLVPQLVALVRRRHQAPPAPGEDPPVGTDPGRTLARVTALHEISDGAWAALLDRVAERARSGSGSGPAPRGGATGLVPDGALAVRGPQAVARAVARAVAVDLAATGAAVEVAGPGRGSWSWCRWLAPQGDGPRVLVVDGPVGTAGPLVDEARHRGDVVVLCLPDPLDGPPVAVPGWCRTVLTVTGRQVLRSAPDGGTVRHEVRGLSAAAAERTARRLAGLRALGRNLGELAVARTRHAPGPQDEIDPVAARLPTTVPLAGLVGHTDLAERWARATRWSVPVGVSASGVVHLDLVADGPHLLVAGTTGSGKSELLQSLVLGLALTRSPADLALVLVDFKGGASFGRCADLPHVVGQVTDLEPGLAARALSGLRAELRRREQVLAARRAASWQDAPRGTLPRLVVVMDEFRALADELPEFLPGLLRVAAQGRSLGVHLVLATQRPAGAVGPDVRANISTRVALRVVDAADSHDVVDSAAAARIPVTAPGRAVLRIGSAPPVVLQCAHAAARADDGPRVTRSTPWRGLDPTSSGHQDSADATRTGAGAPPSDTVAEAVAAAQAAAAALDHRPGPAPWLPPLPEDVTVATLPLGAAPAADGAGLPLALADDPEGQRQHVVAWDPSAGHLAVVGRARSGRTTALLTLASAALDRGWHVHALVPRAAAESFRHLTGHPCFGTLAHADDPRLARRLLHLLTVADGSPTDDPGDGGGRGGHPRATTAGGDGPPGVLVVVDGVEEVRAAVCGLDPWDTLTTALAAGRAAFAVTAETASVGGLAARVGPRLVLLGTDQHQDVVLGAPSTLAGTGGPPGRAAWSSTEGATSCQVLLPLAPQGPPAGRRAAGPAVAGPLRLRRLPDVVHAADLVTEDAVTDGLGPGHGSACAAAPASTRPWQVVVGIGGDDARPVALDVGGGALVVGPRGSGRTTVLRHVVRALAARGRLAGVVSRDPALRADAGEVPCAGTSPAAVRSLLDALCTDGDAPSGQVLVVDDLDLLAQSCPVEVERLSAPDLPLGPVELVASVTTQGALMAHRGPVAELRGRRTGLVLGPGERGSDEVLGTALSDVVDPGPPRPGRGVLVLAGTATPVQTAGPPRRAATPTSADGVLHDPAGHQSHEGEGGERERERTTQHGPRRPARQQRQSDERLEDLPAGDDGTPGSAALAQRAGARREHPGEPEEERHDEQRDTDARRTAPHELDDDRHREGGEGDDLECDDGHHGGQERRAWRPHRGREIGLGDLGSGHHP